MTRQAAHPEAILAELNRLWATLGKSGSPDREGVLRACSMTLIAVEAEDQGASGAAEVLADVVREYPSRVIVLRIGRDASKSISAGVTAQCWKPFRKRQQICCEQIEIQAGQSALADLRNLMVALKAPDLPVALWCRNGGLVESHGFETLCSVAEKIIFDSEECSEPFGCIDRIRSTEPRPIFADLAWTRLTRWRELLAQMFENASCRARFKALERGIVFHGGPRIPMDALYFGASIMRALGWTNRAALSFENLAGAEFGLRGVALSGPGLSLSLRLAQGTAIDTEVNSVRSRVVMEPPHEEALLREELGIRGEDPIYNEVLESARQVRG